MKVEIIGRYKQRRACHPNDSGKSANPVTARDTTVQPESATSATVVDTSAPLSQKEQLNPGTSASDAKAADTCHPAQDTSESRSAEPNQSSPPAQGAEGQVSAIDRYGSPKWINIPNSFEGVGFKASMDNEFGRKMIEAKLEQERTGGPQYGGYPTLKEFWAANPPPTMPITGTNVDHPDHYNAGGIECIDAMEAAATPEEFRGFCKLNALKYLWRERGKNGNEDLEKAAWYLNRAVESSKREKAE
jgi:hypothetical protein